GTPACATCYRRRGPTGRRASRRAARRSAHCRARLPCGAGAVSATARRAAARADGDRTRTSAGSWRDLEDEVQLHGSTQRKARNAQHDARGVAFRTEDLLQQQRGAIGDARMLAEVAGSCDENTQARYALDAVQRPELVARKREPIECSQASGKQPG